MKKLSYLIVLVLILGLVLTGCTLLSNVGQTPASPQISEKGVSDDGSTISVYSDTSVLITKVYNKALGGNSVVDLSGSPLTAVRAWEPKPYPDAYPAEPPEAIGSLWDKGVKWFEDNNSNADWIWETHLANGPADYDPDNDLYDADAAINGRVVLFETTFKISGDPTSATLHIAADNGYEAWVNDGTTHFYSDRVSGPGWETSDLHQASLNTTGWQYDGNFDIDGSEFVNGSNTLYVLAGNEYFAPDDGNTPIPASKYNPVAVIFQLDVDYEVAIEEAPEIAIEKSGPVSAHVGDIITYTYTVTTGTGDVPLSAVAVSDDLAGDAAYVSGDANTNGLLNLGETWIFTANYEVPSGVDPVVNTATAYGTSPQGTEVTAEANWSVDIIHPAIAVEKSGPEAAAPGETVTYTYTLTNEGDVPLSAVAVSDNLAGVAAYDSGDANTNGFLDMGETWIFTADYDVTFDDPEWLINIATAEGTDELGKVVTATDTWSVHTMGARTIGYWKTHPEKWCDFPSGSMFADENKEVLLTYFPGMGAEVDGVNPLEMLRAQLIAAELNYACFEDEYHYTRYEAADIFGTMRDAEAFLQRVYNAPGGNDLNAFWSSLSKKQQNNVKQIANPLKDTLEEFNAMGDEIFEQADLSG